MKNTHYRILENGESVWQGSAYDEDHALDQCYYHENMPTLVTITVQVSDGRMWKTLSRF